MAKQSLTPWYPKSIKPFRCGEYQVRARPDESWVRRFWDGRRWMCVVPDYEGYDPHIFVSEINLFDYEWRGLAFDPEERSK